MSLASPEDEAILKSIFGPALADEGIPLPWDAFIMSTNDRVRGRKLQDQRARHFRDNPLCVECELVDRVRLWTQLDHIIPVSKGGPDTDDNKQGLCDECHAIKTAKDMGYTYRPKLTYGLDGWPK